VLACLAGSALAGRNDWTVCGDAAKHAYKIKSITATAPIIGQEMTITMTGDVVSDVSGGTIHFDTKYNGINIGKEDHPFCDVARDTGSPCPWTVGSDRVWVTKVTLPSTTPHGAFTEEFSAKNGDQSILCVKGVFDT